MGRIDIVLYQERAILAHVIVGSQFLGSGSLRKSWHAVLKDPPVVFADLELLPGAIGRFEVLANTDRAIGINPPREFDPELILLPDFSEPRLAMRFISKVEFLALVFQGHTQNRLSKSDPSRRMCLLAHQVMAF